MFIVLSLEQSSATAAAAAAYRFGGGMTGGLVYDDAFALAELSNVKGVVVEMNSTQEVRAGDAALQSVSILGTTADFPSVRDFDVGEGRYFTESDVERNQRVAVLGYDLAKELFGDADPIGQDVIVGTTRLIVIGVMAEKGLVSVGISLTV